MELGASWAGMVGLTFAAASCPTLGHAADSTVSAAVHQALKAQGPIILPAEQTEIDGMCGVREGQRLRNLRFEAGALVCPDGQIINNDRTRRLEADISARAKAYANAAVHDPAVATAISRLANERAHEVLADGGRNTESSDR